MIALAGAAALLYFGQLFLVTLIMAIIIAFILEPFVVALMRIRLPRALASFVVCVWPYWSCTWWASVFTRNWRACTAKLEAYSSRIAELVEVGDLEGRGDGASRPTVSWSGSAIRSGRSNRRPRRKRRRPLPKRVRDADRPSPRLRSGRRPSRKCGSCRNAHLLVSYLYAHLGSVYECC